MTFTRHLLGTVSLLLLAACSQEQGSANEAAANEQAYEANIVTDLNNLAGVETNAAEATEEIVPEEAPGSTESAPARSSTPSESAKAPAPKAKAEPAPAPAPKAPAPQPEADPHAGHDMNHM